MNSKPMDPISSELADIAEQVRTLNQRAQKLVAGKRVRIASKTYNGQLIGSSRKALAGKVFGVRGIYLDGSTDVNVMLDDWSLAFAELSEVEFIDDQEGGTT